MAKTKIDWADTVWNPVTGCTKISEGCRNCYAERMSKRLAGRCGYPKAKPFNVTLHPDKLEEPLKWKKPQRIFVCSMGDLFHKDVPFEFIAKVYRNMALADHHIYLILTKRPARMLQFIKWYRENSAVEGVCGITFTTAYSHVYHGVTAENQQAADERIPLLLQIPAAKRFISIEPMVGPVDLFWGTQHLHHHKGGVEIREIDWVILGGESGPKARPLHPDWVRSVRDQCQAAGVPFFFKQWGEWAEVVVGRIKNGDVYLSENGFMYTWGLFGKVCYANKSNGVHLRRVDKKAAGHLLDGKEYREIPG